MSGSSSSEEEITLDSTANLEVLTKAYQDVSINEDELNSLPEPWRKLYNQRDMRKSVLVKSHSIKIIERKIKSGLTLNDKEMSFYDRHMHKVSALESSAVEVEALDLLDDVVKGDYTLADVHLVREGAEAADQMDPVENSPLMFLDSLIESSLEQTHETLKTKDPGNFFGSVPTEIQINLVPAQMSDAINNAATAVGIMQGNVIEQNDAKSSIDSYVFSQVMHEAEVKLKQANNMTSETKSTDVPNDDLSQNDAEPAPKRLSFDITDLSYEVSMLPSDDPNVYKPLEIISYIGMTKNIP